jgi:4-diphosphocytidyl-2-C-methyl-D-erythritol kinase
MAMMKAHAKVNLFLAVGEKRADGYHALKTVFQPLVLHDEMIVKETNQPGISIKCDNKAVPVDERNTAHKAVVLMAERANKCLSSTGVLVKISKNIPIAGGLGGSAVDAAPVIKSLNRMWNMKLNIHGMMAVGAKIGSDVPMAIVADTCYAEGKGDEIRQIYSMPTAHICIATPEHYMDGANGTKTALLYSMLSRSTRADRSARKILSAIARKDWVDVGKYMHNDFEAVAFRQHPTLLIMKQVMIEFGAAGALLSGAGSSVFGIFLDENDAKTARRRLLKLGNVRDVIITKTKTG